MKQFLFFCPCFFIFLVSFSQTISTDSLHWSENKKLSWADFKGKEIQSTDQTENVLMAMLANFTKGNPLKPTSASVVAAFDRKKSWAAKETQTPEELKYYQVMFDIYELHARRLRKEFSETKFGMDPDKIFYQKYRAAIAELDDHVKQYKNETESGADADALHEWEEEITKSLKELGEFKKEK